MTKLNPSKRANKKDIELNEAHMQLERLVEYLADLAAEEQLKQASQKQKS